MIQGRDSSPKSIIPVLKHISVIPIYHVVTLFHHFLAWLSNSQKFCSISLYRFFPYRIWDPPSTDTLSSLNLSTGSQRRITSKIPDPTLDSLQTKPLQSLPWLNLSQPSRPAILLPRDPMQWKFSLHPVFLISSICCSMCWKILTLLGMLSLWRTHGLSLYCSDKSFRYALAIDAVREAIQTCAKRTDSCRNRRKDGWRASPVYIYTPVFTVIGWVS